MCFLPRILFILEIKNELIGSLTCLLSFALDLLHLPIVSLLREFGRFLSLGLPVLKLLFHVLQVLGLLSSEFELLIVGQTFQLHHLAVVLKYCETQKLSFGPLLFFFARSFLSFIFVLLGQNPLMLRESGFLCCLFLSSLIFRLSSTICLAHGLFALILAAHLLFLSFILESGLLSSCFFRCPHLSLLFETLLLFLSFKLEAFGSVCFTLKTSRLLSCLLSLLFLLKSFQLLLPRKFIFLCLLPVFLFLFEELVCIRERTAQLSMHRGIDGLLVILWFFCGWFILVLLLLPCGWASGLGFLFLGFFSHLSEMLGSFFCIALAFCASIEPGAVSTTRIVPSR